MGPWTLQEGAFAAAIVSATCFVISLIIALYQIRRAMRNQRYATATQLWDRYLNRAIDYPEFAYPPNFEALYDFEKKEFNKEKKEFERYEWFVSTFLRAADEILEELDGSHHRTKMIRRNVRYHRRYLAWRLQQNIRDDYLKFIGPKLSKMLDEVVSELA